MTGTEMAMTGTYEDLMDELARQMCFIDEFVESIDENADLNDVKKEFAELASRTIFLVSALAVKLDVPMRDIANEMDMVMNELLASV